MTTPEATQLVASAFTKQPRAAGGRSACAVVLAMGLAWGLGNQAHSAQPDTLGPARGTKPPVARGASADEGSAPKWLDFSPRSPLLGGAEGGPDPEFCSRWNPDFVYRGNRCCPTAPDWARLGRGRRAKCGKSRIKYSYCSEMTSEQRRYLERAETGTLGDPLELIAKDLFSSEVQSFCSVSDGFLAWGRPLVASRDNRVLLRRPERCIYFGTDPMVGMLEWVGRRIRSQYPEPEGAHVRLIVGDLSPPKGGCISGVRGRRAHASHTSGQDADLAFLVTQAGRWVPDRFHTQFDPVANWWFFKQLFRNPYACIKVVFLDRKWIRKLEKAAGLDPEWQAVRRHIVHARGHRNHIHVRVGQGPGEPGCPTTDPTPSEEPSEELIEEGGDDGNAGEAAQNAPAVAVGG